MKAPLPVVNQLQAYLDGVMGRAGHHANSVQGVALALAGAIVWRKDPNVDLEVLSKSGDFKNVLWVTISGNKYAFSYDHAGSIDMRKDNLQGPTLHKFDDTMTLTQVYQIFSAL
jgi:16S rRNA C1402 N4-methylase RsmH